VYKVYFFSFPLRWNNIETSGLLSVNRTFCSTFQGELDSKCAKDVIFKNYCTYTVHSHRQNKLQNEQWVKRMSLKNN